MYNTYSDAGLMGGIIAAFFGLFLFLILIVFIISILIIIAQWKMLKKGNEEGWKALIPIYNTYTICKMVGVNPYWVLISFVAVFLNAIPIIGNLAAAVATIYFMILLNVSIAKSFGKDAGFAIGLIFLPYIFYPILGFGKAEFIGANPMEDIIFKNIDSNNTNNTNNTNQTASNNNVVNTASNNNQSEEVLENQTPQDNSQSKEAYCTNCGNKLDQDDAFCTNCGTKRN